MGMGGNWNTNCVSAHLYFQVLAIQFVIRSQRRVFEFNTTHCPDSRSVSVSQSTSHNYKLHCNDQRGEGGRPMRACACNSRQRHHVFPSNYLCIFISVYEAMMIYYLRVVRIRRGRGPDVARGPPHPARDPF